MFRTLSQLANKNISFVARTRISGLAREPLCYLCKDDEGREYLLLAAIDAHTGALLRRAFTREDCFVGEAGGFTCALVPRENKDAVVFSRLAPDVAVEELPPPQVVGDFECGDPLCPCVPDDFVHNRPDGARILVIEDCGQKTAVTLEIKSGDAALGVWLVRISREAIDAACRYVFEHYPSVGRIGYRNCLWNLGNGTDTNHWQVDLPATPAELDARQTAKKRYRHLTRPISQIERELGGFTIEKLPAENAPVELVQTYLEYKRERYETAYAVAPKDFLREYRVSHVYTLTVGDTVGAILFSCEQGENVYLENLTFRPEWADYSMGFILYKSFLDSLIAQGKRAVYLGGGDREYKTRFAAFETVVSYGALYKNERERAKRTLARKLKNAAKRLLGR